MPKPGPRTTTRYSAEFKAAAVRRSQLSGPQGLHAIRGFRDEALSSDWKGFRSSRLNEQWRVIYSVEADVMIVQVVRVTAHNYRRR